MQKLAILQYCKKDSSFIEIEGIMQNPRHGIFKKSNSDILQT